jgi:putative ABC transport system ATP-binding protein
MVALVGPSGSGKTTIINLLGTLDIPKKGNIYVNGKDLGGFTEQEKIKYRQDEVSFVFQFFNLFPTLNVYENIEFPLLFKKVAAKEIEYRVTEAINLVGLTGLEKRKTNELSGGQRQRVAIARALVSNVPLVLADEPTANLDGENSFKVMELMKEINNKFKTTFIFSTHDPRVMSFANKIIELIDGKVVKVDDNSSSEGMNGDEG